MQTRRSTTNAVALLASVAAGATLVAAPTHPLQEPAAAPTLAEAPQQMLYAGLAYAAYDQLDREDALVISLVAIYDAAIQGLAWGAIGGPHAALAGVGAGVAVGL